VPSFVVGWESVRSHPLFRTVPSASYRRPHEIARICKIKCQALRPCCPPHSRYRKATISASLRTWAFDPRRDERKYITFIQLLEFLSAAQASSKAFVRSAAPSPWSFCLSNISISSVINSREAFLSSSKVMSISIAFVYSAYGLTVITFGAKN